MILTKGKSGVYMYGTIALGLLQLLVLIVTASYGIKVMIIASVAVNVLWLGVWHYFVNRYTGLQLREALLDVLPFALVALATVAGVHFATRGITNLYVLLVVRVLLVFVVYIGVMKVLNAKILNEVINYFLKKHKHTTADQEIENP
jgi:hypothetical protein